MDGIKQKIKQTFLFTPAEKIEYLARFDELGEDVWKKVEAIIDEYDQEYTKATVASKRKILTDFEQIQKQQANSPAIVSAIDTMKKGLEDIFSG